jgi:hypothetical protein
MSCSSFARLSSLKALTWAALVAGILSGGAGCAGDSAGLEDPIVPLAVNITSVPPSAQTIETVVAINRSGRWQLGEALPLGDLSPFENRKDVSINLLLPREALYQDVSIGVRVQDAAGKLVALGSTKAMGYARQAAMAAFEAHDDRAQKPMLVMAQLPEISRSRAPDPVGVSIYGWGFQPDMQVLVDGQPRKFDWMSAAQIVILLPKDSLTSGTPTVRVTNTDQSSDTKQLFSVVD